MFLFEGLLKQIQANSETLKPTIVQDSRGSFFGHPKLSGLTTMQGLAVEKYLDLCYFAWTLQESRIVR